MSLHQVRLTARRNASAGTKTFAFERPEGFAYLPGQFFYVSLPLGGAGDKPLIHHFTLSSSPTEDFLAFTTRMTGSEFKMTIDALDDGTVVNIDGPHGGFVLRQNMHSVAYICGGIGITPVRSTLRWATDVDAQVDIVVLYASHDLAGEAFRDELDSLRGPRRKVIEVFSEPPEGWNGATGHVDADLVRSCVSDWHGRFVFVSGPPGMVRSLAEMLAGDVGVRPGRLIVEEFPGYS